MGGTTLNRLLFAAIAANCRLSVRLAVGGWGFSSGRTPVPPPVFFFPAIRNPAVRASVTQNPDVLPGPVLP